MYSIFELYSLSFFDLNRSKQISTLYTNEWTIKFNISFNVHMAYVHPGNVADQSYCDDLGDYYNFPEGDS